MQYAPGVSYKKEILLSATPQKKMFFTKSPVYFETAEFYDYFVYVSE